MLIIDWILSWTWEGVSIVKTLELMFHMAGFVFGLIIYWEALMLGEFLATIVGLLVIVSFFCAIFADLVFWRSG